MIRIRAWGKLQEFKLSRICRGKFAWKKGRYNLLQSERLPIWLHAPIGDGVPRLCSSGFEDLSLWRTEILYTSNTQELSKLSALVCRLVQCRAGLCTSLWTYVGLDKINRRYWNRVDSVLLVCYWIIKKSEEDERKRESLRGQLPLKPVSQISRKLRYWTAWNDQTVFGSDRARRKYTSSTYRQKPSYPAVTSQFEADKYARRKLRQTVRNRTSWRQKYTSRDTSSYD